MKEANGNGGEPETKIMKEANGETEQVKMTVDESVNSDTENSQGDAKNSQGDAENSQGDADSGVASKTEEPTQVNGEDSGTDTAGEVKLAGKVRELAQSDDSDTETFEDADVSMGETDIAGGKREKITPDKDSADDSEAFYDLESDEEGKVKETEA